MKAMCKDLGKLSQGYGEEGSDYHTEETTTVRFLNHRGIGKIPRDRVVTHARIVVHYQSKNKDPNRVRITAGGNLLKGIYTGDLTTRTFNLTQSTCMWNSIIHTPGARFACTDASNFYLATPLEHFQYISIPVHLIP